MKRIYALLLLPFAFLVGACGHTNHLAKFNVAGRTALYRWHATGDAASSIALIESPSDNTVVNVIAAVGSVIVGDQSRKKLERAVNGDSVAHAVSLGIRAASQDYLGMRAVESIAENPDFIVETEVDDIRFVTGSFGIALRVHGESRVIDRQTGTLVWDDSESYTIPLSETYLAAFGPKVVSSGVSIFNAVQLMNLSEEEIRSVVDRAAVDAGRDIGEVLREDISEMRK